MNIGDIFKVPLFGNVTVKSLWTKKSFDGKTLYLVEFFDGSEGYVHLGPEVEIDLVQLELDKLRHQLNLIEFIRNRPSWRPRLGQEISTDEGVGKIVGFNLTDRGIKITLEFGDGTEKVFDYFDLVPPKSHFENI